MLPITFDTIIQMTATHTLCLAPGFTQVVMLYAIGLQDQSVCIGDLVRVQLINPVAAVRLTSVAPVQEANDSTTVDFAIEVGAARHRYDRS